MTNDIILEPGNYSVFILQEMGTWEQPTLSISKPMTERAFQQLAMQQYGGFTAYGTQEDWGVSDGRVVALRTHDE